MSIVSDFANLAFTQASTDIGTTGFTIAGGSSVNAVAAEITHDREFGDGGWDRTRALDLVCNTALFEAAYTSSANAYVGNTAVVNSVTYRIQSIERGGTTTTIRLDHDEMP